MSAAVVEKEERGEGTEAAESRQNRGVVVLL